LAELSDEKRAELKREFRAHHGYGSEKIYFEEELLNTYVARKLGLLEDA
jgi:hypothetical protein